MWSVSTSDVTPLRRAILVESLMESASDTNVLGRPKAIILHDQAYFDHPLALDGLLSLVRTARKMHIYVVVIADSPPPDVVSSLIGTWVVSPEFAYVFSPQPQVPANVPTAKNDQPEPPRAWLLSVDSRDPKPLGAWYVQAEVAAGDQVISTASPAVAFKDADHE